MELTIDEPTALDTFLYYGLFAGAIFQLLCIFAVVFIPYSESEDEVPVEAESKSAVSSQQTVTKKTKKERKKHK